MATTTDAETQEITFPVTGMTCASCVRRIEKALGRVGGVEQANVNLATEKATVVYDPSVATPAQMQAAVQKAGYGVRELPTPATTAVLCYASSVAMRDVTPPIAGMSFASSR